MEQTLFNVTKTLNLVILTNAFCIKMSLEAMSIRLRSLKKFHSRKLEKLKKNNNAKVIVRMSQRIPENFMNIGDRGGGGSELFRNFKAQTLGMNYLVRFSITVISKV